mmetsp:Transcript_752/g.2623  ORF Transcript_752/g.2623 Transcript_752/m.2623 type:complete len:294 (+) Transcript_752:1689-2570(+)
MMDILAHALAIPSRRDQSHKLRDGLVGPEAPDHPVQGLLGLPFVLIARRGRDEREQTAGVVDGDLHGVVAARSARNRKRHKVARFRRRDGSAVDGLLELAIGARDGLEGLVGETERGSVLARAVQGQTLHVDRPSASGLDPSGVLTPGALLHLARGLLDPVGRDVVGVLRLVLRGPAEVAVGRRGRGGSVERAPGDVLAGNRRGGSPRVGAVRGESRGGVRHLRRHEGHRAERRERRESLTACDRGARRVDIARGVVETGGSDRRRVVFASADDATLFHPRGTLRAGDAASAE